MGIDRVVFGLATVDGFHIQRVPEDKSDPFAGTQVGQPVPGEETFDTDDEVLPLGRDGLEKGFLAQRP